MSNYFRELTLNLQHAGFVVKPETEDVADDYRSAALDRANSITDEQGKCLQSIIDQIELSIPNLGELLDQEQNIEAPEDGGMQFS